VDTPNFPSSWKKAQNADKKLPYADKRWKKGAPGESNDVKESMALPRAKTY
jgi:hypothetical protein